MMSVRFRAFSLLFLTSAMLRGAFSAIQPQTDTLTGVWLQLREKSDGTQYKTYFVFKQTGDSISGSMELPWGDIQIAEGTLQGDMVHFQTKVGEPRPDYTGRLDHDVLRLTLFDANAQMRETKIELRRIAPNEAYLPKRIEPPSVRDLPRNGLAQKPPMGWNAWNHFHDEVDDATVRQIADAMVSSGMRDAGYVYLNIDDEWAGKRDAHGVIHPNQHFPDMKGLIDYVHAKGLYFGLYSSPGPLTCESHEGSYGHEVQDAQTYAGWGVDYLKYDWCSAFRIYADSEMRAVYQAMGAALQATGRPIVYSICQYGLADVSAWGPKADGNLWRTTHDIGDNWKSMIANAATQLPIAHWAGPGRWNDPDMLEVGNSGMTAEEYRTHFTLWAMLSAPLIAGNDPRTMSAVTGAMLMNREVIAIDQDVLSSPPVRTDPRSGLQSWTKQLVDGSTAIALINTEDKERPISFDWSAIGIARPSSLRDLWNHRSIATVPAEFTASIPAHGTILLRAVK